jgi:hypothetical protein
MDNVGIAIVDGVISMEELKQNFSDIWKTNWPWQMRKLEENKISCQIPSSQENQGFGGFSIHKSEEEGSVSVFYGLEWGYSSLL